MDPFFFPYPTLVVTVISNFSRLDFCLDFFFSFIYFFRVGLYTLKEILQVLMYVMNLTNGYLI